MTFKTFLGGFLCAGKILLNKEVFWKCYLETPLIYNGYDAHWPLHCLYGAGPSFAFRTLLILHGTNSTSCCKHSSDTLVHVDMIRSHSYSDCSVAHP